MESKGVNVKSAKINDDKNTFMLTCETGRIHELMELTPFIDSNHDWLDAYDAYGQKYIHTIPVHEKENAVLKIDILVQDGADIMARELRTGNTLLHIAVKTQNYKLAEWLCKQPRVERGAVNFNYETAYRIAFKARDLKMMQVLRINGAACVSPMTNSFSDDSS